MASGLLHWLILFILGGLNFFRPASLHLSDLLATPAPFPVGAPLQHVDTLVLRFQDTVAATDSASLLRPITPDEALFLPVLQTTTPRLAKNSFTWDEEKTRTWVASISATIDTHAQLPSASYLENSKTVNIFPGKSGIGLDVDRAVQTILRLPTPSASVIAETTEVNQPLNPTEVKLASERLTKLISAMPLVFTAQDKKFTLTPAQLTKLTTLPTGFSETAVSDLVSSWAKSFDIATVEPELAFNGQKIVTFRAPVEGRTLDQTRVRQTVLETLRKIEGTGLDSGSSVPLAVIPGAPKITLESLNSLGITELIGRGDSNYFHSIPNRIYNVSLATSRIHGAIVMPGETFSFNKTLGDVSAATGYRQAYVIDQGQTVLGDGGGVCQVSSTFFRALLDAGLPITERRGHSYRVGYYEQNNKPGFDATVSGPHPDLDFVNDTGSPILVNAQADSKNLHMYIELYGKKDGRKSEILNYRQWDQSPAPPTEYQDDPTLPAGTLKQIDFAAGGLKTSFEYKVTYPGGNIKDTTYLTTYVPWRAVYLRGTKN